MIKEKDSLAGERTHNAAQFYNTSGELIQSFQLLGEETVLGSKGSRNSKPCPTWELTNKRPCSLSGVELDGESIVRFVYVDESGISANESVVVVAGVVIDADSQWKAVENYVAKLINKYVREEHREGFVFHAKDLFHGSGKIFGDRDKYPLEHSRTALKELLAIPQTIGLPIVYGWDRKQPWMFTSTTRKGQRNDMAGQQAMSFSWCAIAAESYMVKEAKAGEIATIVAENNTDTHRAVKDMHDILRGKKQTHRHFVTELAEMMGLSPDILPLKRIVDTVYFAEKDDAFLLQIADACAFIIRYFIEDKPNVVEFFNALTDGHPEVIGDREKMKIFPAGLASLVPGEVDENK